MKTKEMSQIITNSFINNPTYLINKLLKNNLTKIKHNKLLLLIRLNNLMNNRLNSLNSLIKYNKKRLNRIPSHM